MSEPKKYFLNRWTHYGQVTTWPGLLILTAHGWWWFGLIILIVNFVASYLQIGSALLVGQTEGMRYSRTLTFRTQRDKSRW